MSPIDPLKKNYIHHYKYLILPSVYIPTLQSCLVFDSCPLKLSCFRYTIKMHSFFKSVLFLVVTFCVVLLSSAQNALAGNTTSATTIQLSPEKTPEMLNSASTVFSMVDLQGYMDQCNNTYYINPSKNSYCVYLLFLCWICDRQLNIQYTLELPTM